MRLPAGAITAETRTDDTCVRELVGVDARSVERWRNTESGKEFSSAS